MSCQKINFSVIIPQRNSLATLPRLFSSIPNRDDIEIIVVDNTPNPVTKDEIGVDRDYQLLWSAPERHAGGARNVGIENAHGEWLIFSDADDFFTTDAFQLFDEHKDSNSDIIFYCADGLYPDTGERSDRGDVFSNLVLGYISGVRTEEDLRLEFIVPWSKMIKREFVERNKIRFDEIKAGNDRFFSMVCGILARKVEAVDKVSYIVTVSKGSLTKRRDYEVIKARLFSMLHCNQYLKEHGLANRQCSVMFALYEARRYGIKAVFEFLGMLLKFRQNPFIGWRNWRKTFKHVSTNHKDDKYIV